ncbi:MAG: NPCBM/NEW2 domain-containing protein [Planctomycetales bacterium]|nr:NPCBM/NEW2 domain-containing protein [Planctomycetales bacterium]
MFVLSGVGLVRADDDRDVGPDQIVITRIDGSPLRGMLRELQAGRIVCEGTRRDEVSTDNVINLHWPGRRVADRADSPVVLLANGDELSAQAILVGETDLVVKWSRWPDLAPVKLPLDWVRGFVLVPAREELLRLRLLNRLRSRPAGERQDVVLLTNGDSLTGQVKSLDGKGLALEAATGNELRVELSAIRGVSFNPELLAKPDATGERIVMSLVDGSRLTATRVELEQSGMFRVRLAAGPEFDLPQAAVQSLRFLGGKVVYLSELEPTRFEFTPWLELRWPWQRDLNVLGGPLKLRGEPFAKGIGVHSKSELTYRLDGQYRRFQATAGIDDAANGAGCVTFHVLVDGRRVFDSEPLGGSSPALPVGQIDVTQAETLTLVVDFGEFGDVLDYADWCDALLVK